MAGAHFIQTNFTAGEWSDRLEGRVDLAKYANALYRMENFIIDPRGPAVFRPGFRYIQKTKTHADASRLIPFEFSTTQAYILEFGDQYIRFFKDQAAITATAQNITAITKANPAVVTYSGSDTYANADRVLITGVLGMAEVNNREFTVANVNVGNNTFELSGVDSTAYTTYTSGGTVAEIYEISSPYAKADLSGIKYCQSADVLYLFHSSYAPRKLSRTGHTSWTLTTINFRSPAVKEQGFNPEATLTLAAVTGEAILCTASNGVFQSGDVGRIITSGAGRMSIVSYNGLTQVTCDIIDDFAAVGPITSGSWSMLGSPNGTVTPDIKSPVGAICTITGSGPSLTYDNLLTAEDPAEDNWIASGSGTNEFYIINTAPFYSATEPDALYIDGTEILNGIVGTLGISQWDWGDNDALGYDTIYIRLADGADPDTKSTFAAPDNDYIKKSTTVSTTELFRSTDAGKYMRIHGGFIRITAYISVIEVTGEILKELSATTATTAWTIEAEVWNSTNGYPSCGTFFEERLCLAGSLAYPETVWGSVVGDYENHTPGTDASDAFEFTLAGRQVNVIQWIEPREYLIVGTAGAEWRLGPEDTGDALTPLNVVAKQQTAFGCYGMMPETVGNSTLFLQRAGRKIREFTYQWESNGYVAPDLTILAEHLTVGGILGMAYQQEPYSILWAYLDGSLIAMTYLREQDVIGWHQHPMDNGEVESLACIPGDGYNELWAIIKRTINGAEVRYVEMMEAVFDDDATTYTINKGLNAFFVDSGLTYNSASTTTISGLSHLEGESVSILADGSYQAPKTVTNGRITLSIAAQVVHVGLPYTGLIQPMRLDAAMNNGTAQGRLKKIHDITLRVYRSGPFKVGRDADNLDICQDRERTITFGAAYPLFTGDIPIGYDDRWEANARVMVVQDKPMPLTVVALMPEVSIS